VLACYPSPPLRVQRLLWFAGGRQVGFVWILLSSTLIPAA